MLIYNWSIVLFCLLSGIAHLAAPKLTDRLLSKPLVIRLIGALLVFLAIPAPFVHDWRYWLLFAALLFAGIWRLFIPTHSIHVQKSLYPRWVHGLLLIGVALLVWATMP